MAGGIWEGIGAALQQGVGTYHNVSQQQQQQRDTEARLKLQQEQEARQAQYQAAQLAMQEQQFELQKKDRQRAIANSAIQNLTPGQVAGEDVVSRVREHAPELMSMFDIKGPSAGLNVTDGLGPTGNPLTMDTPGEGATYTPEQATRRATLGEQANLQGIEANKIAMERARKDQEMADKLSQAFATGQMQDTPHNRMLLSQYTKINPNEVWGSVEHPSRNAPTGGTPNIDALVQTIIADPTGQVFRNVAANAALKNKLLPALAAAGYKFPASPEDKGKRDVALAGINETLGLINEMIDETGNLRPGADNLFGMTTGTRWIPGSKTADAEVTLNQLVSKSIVNLIAEMKSQSRTGATGFGQLNLREMQVLQQAANKLSSTWQSDESARKELVRLREKLQLAFLEEDGGVSMSRPGGAVREQGEQDVAPTKPAGSGPVKITSITEIK